MWRLEQVGDVYVKLKVCSGNFYVHKTIRKKQGNFTATAFEMAVERATICSVFILCKLFLEYFYVH